MTVRRAALAVMLGAFVAASTGAGPLVAGCGDNMYTGSLTPVPPVHRVPADVAGAVILVDRDPIIESRDLNHIARGNEQRVPQGYREAMVKALVLAGFGVTADASAPHDLVARLAIAVSEEGDSVRQVYRCGLVSPDPSATLVAQIDWTWPKGTYVDTFEVFDFATHNVATDVATSPRVVAFLRSKRSTGTASAVPDASR